MTTETEGQEAPEDTTAATIAEEGSQPAEAGTEAEGQSGDDAAATAESQRQERKQTAQDRIDEVTRARREAERERDYWRDEALRQQQAAPKPEAAKVANDDAPDPSAYESGEYDPEYIKAVAKHEARQEFRLQADEQARQQEAAALRATVNQKVDAAKAKHSDFEEVVLRGKWDCSDTMLQAMLDSPETGDLAYHLATNPAEARRIAALSPIAQAREIGRLEAKLTQPASQPAKTVTSAPEPAPQARGGGGQFKVSPDTGDFAAFDKAY